MDSYTWTHQCWLTRKDLNTLALCRHSMLSRGTAESCRLEERLVREGQGTLCYLCNLMMTKINICALPIVCHLRLRHFHISYNCKLSINVLYVSGIYLYFKTMDLSRSLGKILQNTNSCLCSKYPSVHTILFKRRA